MQNGKSKSILDNLMEKLKAFSLIELIISLIAISIILAAFAPAISKKLSGSGLTIGGISFGTCPDEMTDCVLCDSSNNCMVCRKELDGCEEGKGVYSPTCSCELCSRHVAGAHRDKCTSCRIPNDGIGLCRKCSEGYYVQNHKCEPCPEGYYCRDGRIAEECPGGHYCTEHAKAPAKCPEYTHAQPGASRCTDCASDEYAPAGSENCTPCSELQGEGCIKCDRNSCNRTDVSSGKYYLRNGKSHKCHNSTGFNGIRGCSVCDENGCKNCSDGYYLNSIDSCQPCNHISGCRTCSHTTRSCTACANGHFMASSLHCPSCSAIRHCGSCFHVKSGSFAGCASCISGHSPLRYFDGKFYCTQYVATPVISGFQCNSSRAITSPNTVPKTVINRSDVQAGSTGSLQFTYSAAYNSYAHLSKHTFTYAFVYNCAHNDKAYNDLLCHGNRGSLHITARYGSSCSTTYSKYEFCQGWVVHSSRHCSSYCIPSHNCGFKYSRSGRGSNTVYSIIQYSANNGCTICWGDNANQVSWRQCGSVRHAIKHTNAVFTSFTYAAAGTCQLARFTYAQGYTFAYSQTVSGYEFAGYNVTGYACNFYGFSYNLTTTSQIAL